MELIFTLDELFRRHDSSALYSDANSTSKGFLLSQPQRIRYMSSFVDMVIHPDVRKLPEYSKVIVIAFDRLFKFCNDDCEDIRLFSEDCLSKLITNLQHTQMHRILRLLQLEMTHNGLARSVRSALKRYAHLLRHVNQQYLRTFIQELVVSLVELSKRTEEILLDELKDSFLVMSPFISGLFLHHNIQFLILNWLPLLTSAYAIQRRVASSILVSLVSNCTYSLYYSSKLLQFVLGLVPSGQGNVHTILGVISCIRNISHSLWDTSSPIIQSIHPLSEVTSSFNAASKVEFLYILQATVFIYHCTSHFNHNIVNASLDSLTVIISSSNLMLKDWLLHDIDTLFQPILHNISYSKASFLYHDKVDSSRLNVDILEDTVVHFESELLDTSESAFFQEGSFADNVSDASTSNESGDSMNGEDHCNDIPVEEITKNSTEEPSITIHEDAFESDSELDVNFTFSSCVLDDDIHVSQHCNTSKVGPCPLVRIIRRICSTNLLTGIPGCILPYESSLTSIQNSSIKLFSMAMTLQYDLFFIDLFPNNDFQPSQKLFDVILYLSHTDPSTVEKTCLLSSSFINTFLKNASSSYHLNSLPYLFIHILESCIRMMRSPNGFLVRASCMALKHCIPELILHCYGFSLLNIVIQFLEVKDHSFWLTRVELCYLLAVIDWGYMAQISSETQVSEYYILRDHVFNQIFRFFLAEEDPRVREAFYQFVLSFIQSYYANVSYFSYTSHHTRTFFPPITTSDVLARTIAKFSDVLVDYESKYQFISATRILSSIALHFKPYNYPNQWGLVFSDNCSTSIKCLSLGVLPVLFERIHSSIVRIHFSLHCDILNLIHSIFKGCFMLIYNFNTKNVKFGFELSNFILAEHISIIDNLFLHLMRYLRIFHLVISSPKFELLKKRMKSSGIFKDPPEALFSSKKDNIHARAKLNPRKTTNKLSIWIGKFSHLPNYLHLFHTIKNLYFVFQHSIEHYQSDRFLLLLQNALESFLHILSYPISTQLHTYTQEILLYLQSTFHILPNVTLMVIEEITILLYQKDKFQFSDVRIDSNVDTLHDVLYLIPLTTIHSEISGKGFYKTTLTKVDEITYVPKALISQTTNIQKASKKFFSRKMERITSKRASLDSTLFTFKRQIKHFEDILTVYLSIYNSTTNSIQQGVLSLLTKLICFQLNYLLIDPNLLFLERIINQIDSFDEGLLCGDPGHLATIFQLLILISFTKPDILSFSKIILLCESVIAQCGLQSSSSAYAIQAIYFHIFPSDYSNQDYINRFYIDFFKNRRDLGPIDTAHRDIIFNLLIRLVEYPQCTILLANLLQSNIPQDLQWIDASLLVIGPWLQKMKRLQIHLDNSYELADVQRLLFSLHPSSVVPISLFFLSLNSTKEIDSISSFLRWIAGALLISKLCLRVKLESSLLFQLRDFVISIPNICIPLCYQSAESAIGERLSPEQTFSDFIFDVLSKSTIFLLILNKLAKFDGKLEVFIDFLSSLISQFLALILWVIKDYCFRSIRLCMISYVLTMSGDNNNIFFSDSNLMVIFRQLGSDFPILFSKWMHLVCIEAQPSIHIWSNVSSSYSKCEGQFCNMSERCINSSFMLDILYQIILDASLSSQLLSKYNVILMILLFQDEFFVSRFLCFLKSDPASSIEIIHQLKLLSHTNQNPIFIKQCICLLKHIHISAMPTYIATLNVILSKSSHPGLIISTKLYSSHFDDISLDKIEILSVEMLQCSLETMFSEYSTPDFLLVEPHVCRDSVNDSSVKEQQTEFVHNATGASLRQFHFQQYFLKSYHLSRGCNILSIENLLPFKTLTTTDLLNILELPTFGFDALQYMIEFCSFKLIECKENTERQEEELEEIRTIHHILDQCIVIVFRYISNRSYGSDHLQIFKTTRCLLAIVDGSSFTLNSVFNSHMEQEIMFHFGFLHLQKTLGSICHTSKVEWLIPAFLCPSYILQFGQMQQMVRKNLECIVGIISQFFQYIIQALSISCFNYINQINVMKNTCCPKAIEELDILLILLPTYMTEEYFPSSLVYPIRSLLLSFCHLDMFYSWLIVPLTLWEDIPQFELAHTLPSFPQPSYSLLQNPENIFEMMKRIATLGWRTKDQFEEIWSLMIRVLVPSGLGTDDLYREEIVDMMRACCIAVEGVTTHLLTNFLLPTPGIRHPSYGLDMQTFGDSTVRYLHSKNGIMLNICDSDDLTFLHTKAGQKIHEIREILEVAYKKITPYRTCSMFKVPNRKITISSRKIERPMDYIGYITVQFSHPPLHKMHSQKSSSGLTSILVTTNEFQNIGLLDVNLPSCIRLLFDLSESWTADYPNKIPLMFLHSILKSMFFLSDLFTDDLQFETLLHHSLDRYLHHNFDDDISRVYLSLTILKSAAAIHKDIFGKEKIYEVIINGLFSESPSVALSSFEGLLFLLRSKHCQYIAPIIPNISSAIRYKLTDSQDISNGIHQRQLLVVISTGFSLIQSNKHVIEDQEFISEFVSQLMKYCTQPYNSSNNNVILAILQTFERLILGFSLEQIDRTSILTLAITFIDRTIYSAILLASVSLLTVCMYTGEEGNSTIGIRNLQDMTQLEIDPMTHNIDLISQTRDKVSLLLKSIRINSFLDAQYIAQILVHMLLDILPSNQSMSTVIAEFLNQEQFNKTLIGWIMYKLFQMLITRGQEKEVRIWGLLCIDSFGQSASIRDAIWNLSCLFISASNDSEICNLFPTVLSRNNAFSSWDNEVFMLSTSSFYNTLDNDDRIQFKKSFEQLIILHPLLSNLRNLS